MTKKLYKLMNWPLIEEIIYSESNRPSEILGAHQVGTQTLIQAFFPGARRVKLCIPKLDYDNDMELADEDGFYAALVPSYGKLDYYFMVKKGDFAPYKVVDPYAFGSLFTDKDLERFEKGIHYSVYRLLGAHIYEIDGVKGTHFGVYAPGAARVSVVGDFNGWDGRCHQMNLLGNSGIFEIFIPEVKVGDNYKFEIKLRDGLTYLKADPYGFEAELRPDTASVVADTNFRFFDDAWLNRRKKADIANLPMSVYEMYMGAYGHKENYRDIANDLAPYLVKMGYTHVELMPIMEHPLDESLGYQTLGYFAPTSRYGKPDDFAYFIDKMHEEGIGVILDWVPSSFPSDLQGLCDFDGTKLYESGDPKRVYQNFGTLMFNYGRPQVSNYLLANALFWIEKYHVDGLRIEGLDSMLYLDYGRIDGEWNPNMYGGNEDLDAIEFIKHLNSIIHKRNPGVFTAARVSSAYPGITESLDNGGLGFDFKWNTSWLSDYISYIKYDPYFRAHHHNELTFSMIYAYSERFILPFYHDEFSTGKKSLLEKMPGDENDRYANVRLSLAYLFTHPGRKLLFMGQDSGVSGEFAFDKKLDAAALLNPKNDALNKMVAVLNEMYKKEPALYALDDYSDGFEWVNCIDHDKCYVSFLRKGEKREDTLLVVANFAGVDQKLRVGVPYDGVYREIFTTDDVRFGGEKPSPGKRMRKAIAGEWDGRKYSVKVDASALSLTVFKFSKN